LFDIIWEDDFNETCHSIKVSTINEFKNRLYKFSPKLIYIGI